MSDEIETGAKKDEGVKVTLSLNNEMLAQMISKGIQDLPREVIHTLSYEAVKTALQDKEFMKHLLFYSEYRGYDWWEHSQPQQWFAEMLSKSFTDEEVKEFRDGIMAVIRDDYHSTVTKALANCFMKKLSDYDFTDSVKSLIYQTIDERVNR